MSSSAYQPAPLLPGQWTQEYANQWYAKLPYLKGSNYVPAYAVNQIEMWQENSFDPKRIDEELSWAQSIGMNTMRVFLHDLLWQQDSEGFKKRIDTFLGLCEKRGIRPMLVLFDSCWDPNPQLGPQRAPIPGVHNSGWVQGPGAPALMDKTQEARLKEYVEGVVSAFGKDKRVLVWDVWNEPDNTNDASYGVKGLNREPKGKVERVLELLPKVFTWARNAEPLQPLTSGVWQGDWSEHDAMKPVFKVQLEMSDVVSFHSYDPAKEFEKRVGYLQRYRRPLFCTEYMARGIHPETPAAGQSMGGTGNTFESILPLARKFNVAAINWGFVAGKSQTYLPWDSWQKPYDNGREPAIWFHDIFHEDGRPYRPAEIQVLKNTL